MFKDFITNASLLVTSFFIIGQLFKDYRLRPSSSWKMKTALGVCFGLQGILLMIYSVRVNEFVIVDLRHIPTVVAAMQGGPVSAVVSAIIITFGRIGLFGPSHSSIVASILMLLIGITCGALAGRKGLSLRRFLLLNTVAMIYVSAAVSLNLHMNALLQQLASILAYHWLISTVVGLLSLYAFLYIVRAHESTRQLQESEARYKRLITASPDATLVLSQDLIVFINEKGIRLLRAAARKELLGRSIYDFFHPDNRNTAWTHCQDIRSGKAQPELIEQKLVCLDDTEIIVELSVSPTVYKGSAALLVTLRDITGRKTTERQLQEALALLQKLSDLDGLTGIANRRKLDEHLAEAWSGCAASRSPLSVIMFDVDHFKAFNDSYGHLGGDEVLRTIASTANAVLLQQSHFIARYGGEEFACVLTEVGAEEAYEWAESIRMAVERLALPYKQSDASQYVTVSLGLATLVPDASAPPEQLIDLADKALYQAKAEGRNRTVCYGSTDETADQ
ncbi:sensor domain-containing diguanylate cyclase [Paenibacillus ehimensis]|uniref:Diguanylate cyclase n=1 Tax=Paenibacillus ehimensis TaxID=79264 RepID=A0ABT8VCT0_9BACL|nr:diguanylate cyclase [Paenibacillus ehimensis]MDO3678767.1 diguanylate cyclase [Paenibacillus ehimensis]